MPAAIDRILDRGKWRITTRPMQQWRIGREMNRRIKKTFYLRGIEIPFPHQTLYWGVAKDGTAPPLRLAAGADGVALPSAGGSGAER